MPRGIFSAVSAIAISGAWASAAYAQNSAEDMAEDMADAMPGDASVETMPGSGVTSAATGQAVGQTSVNETDIEQPGTSRPNVSRSASMNEIIVTARKRTESIQDIPLSVAAFTGDVLKEKSIASFDDIASLGSGVTMWRAVSNVATFYIRGLGTGSGADVFEQSVALFIDGTYAGRQADYNQPLFDVERLEVIKGTQASLLGKNTSLGAISVTTRKPGDELAFNALASYEFELDSRTIEAGIDIPITDTFKVRLAGQSNLQGGWVRNLATGNYNTRTDSLGGRIIAQWEPTDDFDATLLYQEYGVDVRGATEEYIVDKFGNAALRANAFGFTNFETDLDGRSLSTDPEFGETDEDFSGRRAIATINYGLGDHTLTSVSAYSAFKQLREMDIDALPGRLTVFDPANNGNEQFTQEVRLASPDTGSLDYVVGLFFLKEKWFSDRTIRAERGPLTAAQMPITGITYEQFELETTTFSGFGQANLDVTDRLTVSLGLRGTSEKREASFDRRTLDPGVLISLLYPPIAPQTLSFTATNLDGSLGAQYSLTDDHLLYASFSRGTKGGGYFNSPTSQDTSRFKKEVADTIEAGAKLTFADGFLNAALFRTKVKNWQNYLFTGVFYDSPPLDLKAKGVEVQAGWNVTDTFRLTGNVTYLDAERGVDITNSFNDFTPPVNAPEWSGDFNASYSNNITDDLRISADFGVRFKSSVYFGNKFSTLGEGPVASSATIAKGKSYGLVNGRLALGADDGSWEISLIGKNLGDKKYLNYARAATFVTGASTGIIGMPRTIALQVKFEQ